MEYDAPQIIISWIEGQWYFEIKELNENITEE
jgi:hypothetical protein